MIPQLPLMFGPPAIGKDVQENHMVTTEFGDVFDSGLGAAADIVQQDLPSDLTGLALDDVQDVAAAMLGFSMPARPVEPVAAREIRVEPPLGQGVDSADATVDFPKVIDRPAARQATVAGLTSPQAAVDATGQTAEVVDIAPQVPSAVAKPLPLNTRQGMVPVPISGPATGSLSPLDQAELMADAPAAQPALAPLSDDDKMMPLVQMPRQNVPIDLAGSRPDAIAPATIDGDLPAMPIPARPSTQGDTPPLSLPEPLVKPQDRALDRALPAPTPAPQLPTPRMQLRGPTAAESAFQSQVGGVTDGKKIIDPAPLDLFSAAPLQTATDPQLPLKSAGLIAVSGPNLPLTAAQILPIGALGSMARGQDTVATPTVGTQTPDRDFAQKPALLARPAAGPDQMPAQGAVFTDAVTLFDRGDAATLQIAAISSPQPATPQGGVPQTPIPPLVTPQQLAGQILSMAPSAQNGSVELVLNPAELGHLRFEIQHRGEHVQVVLTAERPETLDMLRKYADQLTSEFRNSGFSGASLSFGSWGGNQDNPSAAPPLAQKDDDARPIPPAPIPALSPPRDLSRNLNLRL